MDTHARNKPGHCVTNREAVLASLKVMCARSMHVAVGALCREFADVHGLAVDLDFGTVGGLEAKLAAGETADVLILSRPLIDKLEKAGALVPGSRCDVAKTFIAICVREGAPIPDFRTVEAFARLLQDVGQIAMSDPAVGGSAGVHLAREFDRSGLASTIAAKALMQQSGAEVARRVVEGRADIGLTLSGEIASVAGAVIAGPVPPPFGQETVYCAAVTAASTQAPAGADLIAALAAPSARDTWGKAGFDTPAA